MNWVSSPTLGHWSTDVVPASQRSDCYAHALSSAQAPMSVWSDNPESFSAQMDAIDLGPMVVFGQRGSGKRAHRSPRDVGRSSERSFHLLVSRTTGWTLDRRGRIQLDAGHAVLTYSSLGHDLDIPGEYEFVHVKLSAEWLQRWLPSPEAVSAGAFRPKRVGDALSPPISPT